MKTMKKRSNADAATTRPKHPRSYKDAVETGPAVADDDFLADRDLRATYFGIDDEPDDDAQPTQPTRSRSRHKPARIAVAATASSDPRQHEGRIGKAIAEDSVVGNREAPADTEPEKTGTSISSTAAQPATNSLDDEDGHAKLIGEIHEPALGCLRVGKAYIEFGRAAGQKLIEARDQIGTGGFDAWVQGTLAISPLEAEALINFAEAAEINTVDVSPARAMTLTQLMPLVARLAIAPTGINTSYDTFRNSSEGDL
jgi:hypothetical protein